MAPLSKKKIDNKTKLYEEVVAANELYAQTYVAQPNPFSRRGAVLLTCMDARILTHNIMGVEAGDIYVVRNAGGRASDDAIRSLIIASVLLKANQFFIVHHTECGMQRFTDKSIKELLDNSLRSITKIGYCNAILEKTDQDKNNMYEKKDSDFRKNVRVSYKRIDWLTIQHGLFQSVLEDVKKIRNHPLISPEIPIYGFIFDVITGKLIPVNKAIKAGRPQLVCCK